MEQKKKPISKKLISLLGLLLLGAAGSGLWDIFLKRLVFNIGGYFVDFISHLYTGYIDSLYENVGRHVSALDFLPSLIFIVPIMISPFIVPLWINTFFTENENDEDNQPETQNLRPKRLIFKFLMKSKIRLMIFFLLLTIPMSIMYTGLLIEEISCTKAYAYVERTIEIVRPYISSNDYLILRSDLRQIDNKDSFESILVKIHLFATKTKIKLPESEFYGIDLKKYANSITSPRSLVPQASQ